VGRQDNILLYLLVPIIQLGGKVLSIVLAKLVYTLYLTQVYSRHPCEKTADGKSFVKSS